MRTKKNLIDRLLENSSLFRSLATKQDLKEMEKRIMANINEVIADVTAETTLETSLVTLLSNVQSQLTSALANVSVPVATQAQIDGIFALLEANKTALTAALTANTPVVVNPSSSTSPAPA